MKYLFAASVGPVQGFITAARKTRDLYAGSWIVSEIAKAVARELQNGSSELIFPSAEAAHRDSGLSVSNKILALVETESPERIASAAREATKRRIDELCANLRTNPHPYSAETLTQHVREAIEFYAAWVPLAEGGSYQAAYREVQSLMASRKATNAFPAHEGVVGRKKSSLDGMRESILIGRRKEDNRIEENEELDGVGFLKRFLELGEIRFDSVRDLVKASYPGEPKNEDDLYYGILMADGDGIGRAIAGMSKTEHRELSTRLSGFARAIRARLDSVEMKAMTVFAGGDELIAMAPLHLLLDAAKAVRDTFTEYVGVSGFTISAGIAIVHEMEPLEGARDIAEAARREAKRLRGKNGLCITEVPRSGVPVQVAGDWDWMLKTIGEVTAAYIEKRLSFGFAHDLWEILERTPRTLEPVRAELAMAVAGKKGEVNASAAELVKKNRERLEDLMRAMLVARKPAKAKCRWNESAAVPQI